VTVCITALASLVALAAAVRSTWSPCGLSMLSTITPLSEQAKGHSYRSTATWFVVGATMGGATLGAAMALLASAAHSLHPSPMALGVTALGAALIAVGSDAGIGGMRLPIHRRQVNERWLDQYRSWVYGAGFGWQIGTGLSTYITTAAVYLMVVLGALTTEPLAALALGTCFGLMRGLAVSLTRHLTSPSELRSFHRRFAAVGPAVGKGVIALEVGVSAVLAAYLRSPTLLAIVGGAMGLTAIAVIFAKRWGLGPPPTVTPPTHVQPALSPLNRPAGPSEDSVAAESGDPVTPGLSATPGRVSRTRPTGHGSVAVGGSRTGGG
jgi:hypothetical protein